MNVAAPERFAAQPALVETVGPLLRMWRTGVLQMSAREMASALHVWPSTVSQWESDARRVDPAALRSVRELAEGRGGDLGQLLDRAGTPRALLAAHRWEHNFPADAPGVLAWVRSTEPNSVSKVQVNWGILQATIERNAGSSGLLLYGPGGVTNPRLVVDLEVEGWCDFFVGEPSADLGIDLVAVASLLQAGSHRSPFSVFFARHVRDNLPPDTEGIASVLGANQTLIEGVMAEHELQDERVTTIAAADVADVADVARTPEASIRQARSGYRLSQQELADMVEKQTGRFVTQDAVSRLERGLDVNDHLMTAAIDRTLGADGRLTRSLLKNVIEGSAVIKFPTWWVGPIWIRVDQPALVSLTWPPYAKRLRVESGGTVLYTRCADPATPLEITVTPNSVTASVGLGRHPGAVDINDQWWPASIDFLNETMFSGEKLVLKVFNRSRSVLNSLIRTRRNS